MTDLRTRIAAALRNATGDLTYEALADAVIRELGLTSERRHPIVTESGITVGNWMIPTQSRYVTEWVDDE